MALIVGEVRRLDSQFAFTLQLHEHAKILEIVCETKDVARRRVRALKEADCARAEALQTFKDSGSLS
jgi:hypothetical protein